MDDGLRRWLPSGPPDGTTSQRPYPGDGTLHPVYARPATLPMMPAISGAMFGHSLQGFCVPPPHSTQGAMCQQQFLLQQPQPPRGDLTKPFVRPISASSMIHIDQGYPIPGMVTRLPIPAINGHPGYQLMVPRMVPTYVSASGAAPARPPKIEISSRDARTQDGLACVGPVLATPIAPHSSLSGSVSPSRQRLYMQEYDDGHQSKKTRLSSTRKSVSQSSDHETGPQEKADLVKSQKPGQHSDEPMIADGLEGERRLVIEFESFGTRGEKPQSFGKRGLYIPDGLIGTHTAYEELWRFEIHHTKRRAGLSDAVCILWRITNIKSGETVERTETPEEAELRNSQGWTIASQIFREALRRRAEHLESTLEGEANPTRQANIKSLVKSLRPKTFTQGPLVFGLKHRIVQEKLAAMA